MIESVLISMDRGCNKENTVLGCRHHRSLVTSVSSSPKTPLRHSDVDFHDVFGGPPRRLSNQATRYSIGEGPEPSALRGDGDGVSVRNPWTGLSEKPVFGEDSGNRRRYPREDFFDDIFRGDNSVSSSPKAHDRDPFSSSSSPGSRVLSPVVPLPPPQSEIFGTSSNPAQLSTSPPSKVTRAMDFPSLRDPRPSDGTSYPFSPPSRFSNQAIQGQDGLKNDPWPSYRQSRLSHEFSLANDESPNLTTSNRADMGENLEHGSNSSTIEINSSQSHFSLYKWATKGVPFVIPLRRVNSSRIKVKSKTERCSSTNGRFERMVSELPEAALQDVEYHYPFDDVSASTKSFRMELEKQKNETHFTTSAQDGLQECQIVEEVAALAIPNPEPLSGIPSRIEDDADSAVLSNGRKEGKPYSLAETGLCGKTDREISELAREVRNAELKTLRLLLHETDEGQGNSEVAGKDGGNESRLKTTKKSSVNVVPESAKNQGRKETASDNAEVDKASLQQSPINSEESLGRNGAKGKVREFVKIFNQEVSSKLVTNSEPRSQSSRWKNSGPFGAEKGANVSATETEEQQMHVDNTNRNKMVPDASVMVDEIPTKQKRQYSGIKTATHKSSGTTYVQTDGSAPVPGDSEAVDRERQDSFQGNFVIKELTQEQTNQPQIGEDHDEIQVSDAKIRKWLSGKEGNIRSLLSTLQYVLWPESGWKPVPLVDIIEGNAVKRAYQKALLCLHPDKLQQKGAALHQKYIAEKVFDSLQEAWTHFNSLGSF